jgi:broad specificity phosphatase PhoE
VIVARHGERLDYVQRDAGLNWVQDNVHLSPYDPPLTNHGLQQATKLGQELLARIAVQVEGLPPITAVYSSPFLRCRQTAAAIVQEINAAAATTTDNAATCLKVRVEEGLSESINESWYRSWSLPRSDGTWGFRMKGGGNDDDASVLTDQSRLHPKASIPIQSLLSEWRTTTSCSTDSNTNDDYHDDLLLLSNVDYTHESKTKITSPYQLYPRHLESRHDQRRRMYQTVQELKVPGQTIVLVSHGGPVTHLYEQLSGNTWQVHGESTYCCYSIYQQQVGPPPPTTAPNTNHGEHQKNDINSNNNDNWTPIVVNESKYLDETLVTERHDQN